MDTRNSILGWIALIVSLIAIVLAWMAFNRAGVDVEAIVQQEAETRAAELRVDFEELERELRAIMATELNDAADDVADDDTATTTP